MFINIVRSGGFPSWGYLYIDNELKADGLITAENLLYLLKGSEKPWKLYGDVINYKVEYFSDDGEGWHGELIEIPRKYTNIPKEFLISKEDYF